MLEEEMKKRKLNREENLLRIKFPEMAENQMDQARLTRKVSDLKELVDELYGIVETVARTSTYQYVAVLTTVTIFLSLFRCDVDVELASYRYKYIASNQPT
jgi:vacuolar-type H+-ATPase subunit E/Vma4